MELPTTLENCHHMIRELVEENAALRKSGDDFGHLAERLNTALQEARRRASEQVCLEPGRKDGRKRRIPSEDGGNRWSGGGLPRQAASSPASATAHSRHLRTGSAVLAFRAVRWIV
jgi:hypothetical protein